MMWLWAWALVALTIFVVSCTHVADDASRPRDLEAARPGSLTVTFAAGAHDRFDAIVETPIDKAAADGGRLRVAEVDEAGVVIDETIPCQFDTADGAAGTLIFPAGGRTPAGTARRFLVFISAEAPPRPADPIETDDDVIIQGHASLRIATPAGVWGYHKAGGGFAALVDVDGNDWISFRPTGGSAGHYRGIPNLVHPDDYFHPGRSGCRTRLVHAGPLKVTIESTAEEGAWATRWEITPRTARLTVLAATKAYWCLYEGTPGGRLDEASDFCLRSGAVETSAADTWQEPLPRPKWVCFGDRASRRALCLVHHDGGDEIDSYRPMEHNMTVFGFGRRGLEKFLTGVGARFTVALIDEAEPSSLARAAEALAAAPTVAVEAPQAGRER